MDEKDDEQTELDAANIALRVLEITNSYTELNSIMAISLMKSASEYLQWYFMDVMDEDDDDDDYDDYDVDNTKY